MRAAVYYGARDVRVAGRLASPRCRPVSAAVQRRAREHYGLPVEGRLAFSVRNGKLVMSALDG